MATSLKVGKAVRLTKRRTGEQKGNPYSILQLNAGKALLAGANGKPDRWFDQRDLS